MKRLVGIGLLLASIPFWALFHRSLLALQHGPFADELGSAAYRLPPSLEAMRIGAILCLTIGSMLLFIDYRRRRGKPHV